jgi:hypothetical protein
MYSQKQNKTEKKTPNNVVLIIIGTIHTLFYRKETLNNFKQLNYSLVHRKIKYAFPHAYQFDNEFGMNFRVLHITIIGMQTVRRI